MRAAVRGLDLSEDAALYLVHRLPRDLPTLLGVLDRLDVASSQPDPALRKSALTFVFVGGGYAGVEAFAELEDMARYATRYFRSIKASDLRFLLVEASQTILPEVGPEMSW